MNNTIWNESYVVGKEEIDKQHKKILNNIEYIRNAINNNEPVNYQKAHDFLIKYMVEHLGTEEKILISLPEETYARHKTIHNDFKKKLLFSMNKWEKETDFDPRDLLSFLENWWTNHIKKIDQQDLIPD